MRFSLSKMSITRQFSILAVSGIALTLAAVGLSLTRSYDLAFEAKRAEVRHLVETQAAAIHYYIDKEKSGAITHQEAQSRAVALIEAIRFDSTNYFFAFSYDGVQLATANKSWVGLNRIDVKDERGTPYVRQMVDMAKAGTLGFVDYYNKRPGTDKQALKVAYVVPIPEWQWLVSAGIYADDVEAAVMDSAIKFAALFVPLFALFLGFVYFSRRAIVRLLSSFATTMRRLATGAFDTTVEGLDRRDDLGQMAQALVTFRQAGLDKIALEKEAAEQQQMLAAEQRRKAEMVQTAMEANRQVVGSLGTALERLSRGDLTLNVSDQYAAEYEEIRANFNAAVAQLRETMSLIAQNTQAIHGGSVEIATASDDLAQRTERQAATLAETAATLAQIAQTVNETARGASEARNIVKTALADAEQGGAVVRSAVEAMGEIEKSASEISQIIGLIDEIAFQTNLLALNAGVEAARAGEAGRGFAVVASEVRALAQRSAEAAKNIKALIQVSTSHVSKGVAEVGETGKALERIESRIAEINELIARIADSAQHQATSLGEVNLAVDQMDKTTQQNAAMVEESTAASHSLASEANLLADLVGRFELGQKRAA